MTVKEMAKKNYERGLWTIEMLNRLVQINRLSADEFKEITGQDYIVA